MIAGGGAPLPLWFVAAFVVVFPLWWCVTLFVLSRVGGWHALAQQYPGGPGVEGVRYRMASARLGKLRTSYQGSLNVTVAREGLWVAPLLIFRVFHPPLLLPWSCVVSVAERELAFTRVLEVRCEPGTQALGLLLPLRAAEAIADARTAAA